MSSSTGRDVLDTALQALAAVTLAVAPPDWHRLTPCEQWDATQVLQHATGDQLAWAAAISGGPRPTENPFNPLLETCGIGGRPAPAETSRTPALPGGGI